MNGKTMKGFFFTLISLVLLIYVFISLNAKSQFVNQETQAYKDTLKDYSYNFVLAQTNNESIS